MLANPVARKVALTEKIRVKSDKRRMSEMLTILLIDDDAADQLLFKSWLEEGFGKSVSIATAKSAQEAQDFMEHTVPSCIILDFVLYGLNGLQFMVNIHHKKMPIPPIIMLSSLGEEALRERIGPAPNVVGFLGKTELTAQSLNACVRMAMQPLGAEQRAVQ